MSSCHYCEKPLTTRTVECVGCHLKLWCSKPCRNKNYNNHYIVCAATLKKQAVRDKGVRDLKEHAEVLQSIADCYDYNDKGNRELQDQATLCQWAASKLK